MTGIDGPKSARPRCPECRKREWSRSESRPESDVGPESGVADSCGGRGPRGCDDAAGGSSRRGPQGAPHRDCGRDRRARSAAERLPPAHLFAGLRATHPLRRERQARARARHELDGFGGRQDAVVRAPGGSDLLGRDSVRRRGGEVEPRALDGQGRLLVDWRVGRDGKHRGHRLASPRRSARAGKCRSLSWSSPSSGRCDSSRRRRSTRTATRRRPSAPAPGSSPRTPMRGRPSCPMRATGGEKPRIDKIELKVVPDELSRSNGLRAGDLDIIGGEWVAALSPPARSCPGPGGGQPRPPPLPEPPRC